MFGQFNFDFENFYIFMKKIVIFSAESNYLAAGFLF